MAYSKEEISCNYDILIDLYWYYDMPIIKYPSLNIVFKFVNRMYWDQFVIYPPKEQLN